MSISFNLVIVNARKLYKKQIIKNDQTKRLCLYQCSSKYSGDFFEDYRHKVLDIIDSKRFCDECSNLNLNPMHVAQNMVFDGVKGIENIDKYIGCKLIFD